jgi:bis(5'-nucleosyl)-tetraphosphatase (symmetrical)
MVHAGIPMEWHVTEAVARAAELEAALRGPDHGYVLRHLFGNTPAKWHPDLDGIERLRYITNALTRQRFVYPDGRLELTYKKTLAGAPAELIPWFAVPGRASAGQRIVFGHWAALERVAWPEYAVWGIDTGAAWGGQLTALTLDTQPPALVQVTGAGGQSAGIGRPWTTNSRRSF